MRESETKVNSDNSFQSIWGCSLLMFFFVPLVVTVARTKHMGPVTPQNLISIDTPNMLVVAERTPYLQCPS